MHFDPSRLGTKKKTGDNWFDRTLPLGSLQRKLVVWLGIPLVSIVILLLIFDSIVMPMMTRHGSEFRLPDMTGKTIAEAEVVINQYDLSFEVTSEEYSPGLEKGMILNQFPVAGTLVKSGRRIKFVTSLGQRSVAIPQLGGLSVRQAMLDLETAGLILGDIAWAVSDTLPDRVVVFSYPAAGTEIPMGSPVNLMVNRGRASDFTYVPAVIGLTIGEARKRLEEKFLKVGIVEFRTNENYLPETVLEQSEAEGTEIDVGTEIDLVVSTTQ